MSDISSLVQVAQQLDGLAADAENQPIIAREEGCLSALISFIATQDPEVAPIALSAMRQLASHPENTEFLFAEIELVDALKDASGAPHLTDDASADALAALRYLTPETAPEALMELDLLERRLNRRRERRAARVQAGGSALDLDDDLEEDLEISKSPDRFRIPVADKGRDDPITQEISSMNYELLEGDPQLARIQIPGISDEEERFRLETYLVSAKGFLSVSFEIGGEIAVIFSRIPDSSLLQMIAKMRPGEGDAHLLPPDDPGHEYEESKQTSDGGVEEEEEIEETGYIDIDAKMRYKHFVEEQQKRTTLAHGGGTSLAAKLEAQRRAAERQQARTGRLLNRFGSGWSLW